MQSIEQKLLLILFLRIGLMAALASLVVAFTPLRETLTNERKGLGARFGRVAFETMVLASGIWARIAIASQSADMSVEGAFLIGWVHGGVAGVVVGIILGLFETWGGHWLPIIILPLVGIAGAQLAAALPEAAGWIEGARTGGRKVAQDVATAVSVLMLSVTIWIAFGKAHLVPDIFPITGPITFIMTLFGSALSVVIPLYIWRGVRMEAELERHTRQIEKARMEVLMTRFRPHFLFNTLGAIVSLMRTDVEGARNMTLKLAALLRRSMRGGEGFVPLAEELHFVRDYLDIEAIRHGDRLKVVENIEADVLDVPVPKMVLQPLVENAIVHGIDPKVEGGTISIDARRSGDYLKLTVSDDGVGLDVNPRESGSGIGISNLKARLETAYGAGAAKLEIEESLDRGVNAVMWIPLERKT